MRRSHLAVPTKLWALLCVMVGVSLTSNAVLTCTLTLLGFTYLGFQRNWRLLRSFGVFYLLLAVLLYLIRFHGFHMAIFSEFYVLMLWNLSLRPGISLPRPPVSSRRFSPAFICPRL